MLVDKNLMHLGCIFNGAIMQNLWYIIIKTKPSVYHYEDEDIGRFS